MGGQGGIDKQNAAEQVQAAEREAAKLRLLAQAEADNVPVEETTRARPERRSRRGE